MMQETGRKDWDRNKELGCLYEGKWLDNKQDFPALPGKFLGLIQGLPLPVGGGPRKLKHPRGETLVLPAWGSKSQGRNRGEAILVPHPAFPTRRGGCCGIRDFPRQLNFLGNQRQLQGGAHPRPAPRRSASHLP